jgi:hypothetical protein
VKLMMLVLQWNKGGAKLLRDHGEMHGDDPRCHVNRCIGKIPYDH